MFWHLFKSSKDMDKELDKKIKDAMKPWQDDINFLQSMQKLEIKEGDILVFRYPGVLSPKCIKDLTIMVQKTIKEFGYDVRILVLEGGMEVGTLRKE